MIPTSTAFQEAIVGSPRRIELLAVVDISDPDKVVLPTTASPEAPWSKNKDLNNYEIVDPPRYATLERGRWLLDGTFDLFEDDYRVPDEVGYVSKTLSDSGGVFSEPQWIQLNFTNVRILQACSLFFPTDPVDGVPMDFTVEVIQGNTSYFTQIFTGNHETEIKLKDFTVYDPTAIRLTVTRMTLPSRRLRMVEFIMGLYERWGNGDLYRFTCNQQGQFSCLSLPYGSVNLAMDNLDRRFEPRKKDSIFQSIEERQGVDIYIGVRTNQGTERVKLGVYYQAGDGWKTSSNEITMSWYLVDIIGLLTERTFIVPDPLPGTLGGWIREIVAQLGDGFKNRWIVDPTCDKSVTANSVEDVTGKKCGDIIRWACQVAGAWPRADAETGKLAVEPLWKQGNKYTLDNLERYPTMKANESLAALIFNLADGNNTQFIVSGNSTTSEKTVTIQNPFLHTQEQALEAAKLILSQYGGNILEMTGRGDPSSEIGDVDTVWLDESNATTARRMKQTFNIQDGVLRGCQSTLLQADSSYLWESYVIIRESGTWKAPPGVNKLRVTIGQGGQGGGVGSEGYIRWAEGEIAVDSGPGEKGADGQGGAIWYGVIDCNEEQEFEVNLGAGGAPGNTFGRPGSMGGHTTFGNYSSEPGTYYPNGYTDIANAQAFARPGVPSPLPGTGDGGAGGNGGDPGEGYIEEVVVTDSKGNSHTYYRLQIDKPGGPGYPGARGATGFVMVSWDKPN